MSAIQQAVSSVLIDASRLRPAALRPPPSKSDLQRALLAGHLLWPGRSLFATAEPESSTDVAAMRAGLARLARGVGDEPTEIDCGDGGVPLRFLLGQAALTPGRWRFSGTPRLGERPLRPLLDALLSTLGPCGLSIERAAPDAPWPLMVEGTRQSRESSFTCEGAASSQFVSSLLFAAAALAKRERHTWSVIERGATASTGYLDLTLRWLERAGFSVIREGSTLSVAHAREVEALPEPPADWSSAGYLLLLSWASGGTVEGLDPDAPHPDRAFVDYLRQAGLAVDSVRIGDHLSFKVMGSAQSGLEVDASLAPDSMPALAALAMALPSPSRLTNATILRAKESDRMEGIVSLVRAVGGEATPSSSGASESLLLMPPPAGRAPRELFFDPKGDHRMAMAAATLAALLGLRARIQDAHCVAKSFSGFYGELAATGVKLERDL